MRQQKSPLPRPTIRSIAQECNVSSQSVSFALTNKGRLAPETRERILKVAKELGYRPNSLARTMRNGRFGAVALLLSTDDELNFTPPFLISSIGVALASQDMHLTLAYIEDKQLTDETYVPRLLREWSCDGLLINYLFNVPSRLLELVERYRLPVVWINQKKEADCVYPDDYQSAHDATAHLLKLGHRRILYIESDDNLLGGHYSKAERRRGYETAMSNAKCKPCIINGIQNHPSHDKSTYLTKKEGDHIANWLRQHHSTAVLAYSEIQAMWITEVAASCGLRIPEDMSLVTIHWGGVMALTGIDYWYIPGGNIGEAAVEMLLNKIQNPADLQAPVSISCGHMSGRTIAPPPQK